MRKSQPIKAVKKSFKIFSKTYEKQLTNESKSSIIKVQRLRKPTEVKIIAVKDFKVAEGQKAIVCNADGKVWKMDKLTAKVKNAMVIGTDSFPNELGEQILHIWID